MEVSKLINLLSFLSPVALLIGGATGIFYFKRIDVIYKFLTIYILIMLCVDLSTRFLSMYTNNFILFPLYCMLELLFFVYFFTNFFLAKRKKLFMILGALGAVYIFAELLLYFIIDELNIKQFQPDAKVVDNFIIILMCLAFLLEKVNAFKQMDKKLFQLNIVILIFFTVTILVFLPFNFLVNENTGLKFYFWLINIISLVLFYSYITHSIWQNAVQQKTAQTK